MRRLALALAVLCASGPVAAQERAAQSSNTLWKRVKFVSTNGDFSPGAEAFADRCLATESNVPLAPTAWSSSGYVLDDNNAVRFGRWFCAIDTVANKTASENYTFKFYGCLYTATDLTDCTALDADASTAGTQAAFSTDVNTADNTEAEGVISNVLTAGQFDFIGLCTEGDADVTDSAADSQHWIQCGLWVQN